MNEKQNNNDIATAALRLSVIQPAFNGTFPDMNKQTYYARIAAKPLKLPDGREVRYARVPLPAGSLLTGKAVLTPSSQNSGPTGDIPAGSTPMPSLQSMNCGNVSPSYLQLVSGRR
ncbi:MAG: hypothetical protein K2O84_04055 [Oscillospiraceae bacterium]|nr:hypothetical protein [Oscillospiraceae bacterium]